MFIIEKRSSRKNDKENVDDGSGAIKKNIKPDVDDIEGKQGSNNNKLVVV